MLWSAASRCLTFFFAQCFLWNHLCRDHIFVLMNEPSPCLKLCIPHGGAESLGQNCGWTTLSCYQNCLREAHIYMFAQRGSPLSSASSHQHPSTTHHSIENHPTKPSPQTQHPHQTRSPPPPLNNEIHTPLPHRPPHHLRHRLPPHLHTQTNPHIQPPAAIKHKRRRRRYNHHPPRPLRNPHRCSKNHCIVNSRRRCTIHRHRTNS